VLQCVAVCVAVCCSVLPCVAAWLCVLIFWSLSFFDLFGQQTVQISNACRTVLRLNKHTLTQCLAIVEEPSNTPDLFIFECTFFLVRV